MSVVLLSTYDLGRQPYALASAASWLRQDGTEVTCCDLAVEPLNRGAVRAASLIAISLPMHTATRIAIRHVPLLRELNPDAHLCAFGLYAPLAADALRAAGIQTLLGAEFERDLLMLWRDLQARREPSPAESLRGVPRLDYRVPDRAGLPPLAAYARLRLPDGSERIVGATEASRGCRHHCLHCPVVPIYQGRFRAVPVDVVLADVDAQVEAGAGHVTFSDPDFFNGPGHGLKIVGELHRRHPRVSYDVTVKVEHLLRDTAAVAALRDTGCAFVTSAVESFDDRVLALMQKGHTLADTLRMAELMRDVGLPLQPTFIPFHPWMTLDGYRDFLSRLLALGWVDAVRAVQLAIRLLVPAGSALLTREEVRRSVGPPDEEILAHPWVHADARVDTLQRCLEREFADDSDSTPIQGFALAWQRTHEVLGEEFAPVPEATMADRSTIPYLTEPWYC